MKPRGESVNARRKAEPEIVVRASMWNDAVDARDRKALAAAEAEGNSRRDGIVRVERV